MAYERITVKIELATDANYVDREYNRSFELETQPTYYGLQEIKFPSGTSGSAARERTIERNDVGTGVNTFWMWNTGATSIDVSWTDSNSNANTQRVAADRWIVITDTTTDIVLAGPTGASAASCRVWYSEP